MTPFSFNEWFCLVMGLALLGAIVYIPDVRLALLPLLALVIQFIVRKSKPKEDGKP